MNLFYFLLVFVAGVGVTLQLGVNSQLRQIVINPVLSSFISFLVGTIALAIYLVSTSKSVPNFETFRVIPWWKYLGGILGAFYVTSVIIAAPRIGAANVIVLIVAGQLLMALLCDHFGLLGFTIQPINVYRILGALLILGGVFLMQRK